MRVCSLYAASSGVCECVYGLLKKEGGREHAGLIEWVANIMTQAHGWTVSGPPDPFRAKKQRREELN